MCALADEIVPPHIAAAIRQGEPIGDVAFHKYPTSRWRRYHKLERFPGRHPAVRRRRRELQPHLRAGHDDDLAAGGPPAPRARVAGSRPRREFNKATAKSTFPVWTMNAIGDLVLHGASGPMPWWYGRSAGSSTSSSARPKRILFSRNGFCAGSAFSTACTWSRRRIGRPDDRAQHAAARWPRSGPLGRQRPDRDLVPGR